MPFRVLITPVFVAALLVLAAATHAQMPGGGSGGMGRGGMSRGTPIEPRDAAPRAPDAIELLQIQLDELEEDLKLAPGQRQFWDGYAKRVQQFAGDVTRTRNALRYPKGDAPQQLDFVADVQRNRVTAIEDIAEAGKALYVVLTPQQREVADRRLARIAIAVLDAGQAAGNAAQTSPGRAPAKH